METGPNVTPAGSGLGQAFAGEGRGDRGQHLLPPTALDAIARPYEGREVTLEELFRLKDELTPAFVDAGYITPGATLPDHEAGGAGRAG